GGSISISSEEGKGTTVVATFEYDNIDRKPLGDIPQTLITLIAGNPEVNFIYSHRKDDNNFFFNTEQIKRELGDLPINNVEVLSFIRKSLINELKKLKVNFY
ncbi:ATP-binding protein, partial [candidate division KSB1 bacterium]